MRQFILSALCSLTFFTSSLVYVVAQTTINSIEDSGYWSDITLRADAELPTIKPASYRSIGLDVVALKGLLDSAPYESQVSAKNSSSTIYLPMPDGTVESFSFVNSPVMAPALASRFPEIQVYLGQGIDNPTSIVRFDLTPQGFHAMILRSESTVYIDPYTSGDLNKCISYTKSSFYEATDKVHEGCLVEDPTFKPSVSTPKDESYEKQVQQMGLAKNMNMVANGSTLRTYRLALACTGEYAAFHGGTTAGALAAMNTSMARVNGVYERDLCIRMIIVANNTSVIYLNSASDPYTNGNGSAMLSQNQNTCDSNIGSANYDIGHVFSTGGGGVAYLQSPCSSIKAGGVTGQSSPVNDPFDIDYVAHEMGHQWGANHTQNNSCNRSAGAAFEPGSASTIMGYAGICAPNLQTNSDDHFHNHSINEMISFTVTGGGNSCAVTSSTFNSIPTVVGLGGGSTIPANTPFELEATGADADGDPITYNWEEYDLGPTTAAGDNNLTNPSGNQPIFRSWSSSTSNTRTFPKIADIVNGTTTIGELLPTYTRGLKFKCSVRDNRAGGGGFVDDLITLSVDGNSGPFILTSPNSGFVSGNSFATVTWNVAGTNLAPVNCSSVSIWLSTDGGYTYPNQLISGTPNSGSATVLIPNITSTTARFKVKGEGNVFFDISDGNVTITQGVGGANWDLAVQGVSGLTPLACATSVSPVVSLVNLGVQTITNFTLIYDFNGGTPTTQLWTGSLATGATVDIILCPGGLSCFDLGSGTHTFNASVVLGPANGPDEDATNNATVSSYTASGGSQVTFTLLTDNYPGETTWTVTNSVGSQVWSGGPYAGTQTTYVDAVCLPYDCYTLSVFDSFGDGMQYAGVVGNYQMVDASGNILATIIAGGNFGAQADHAFCVVAPVVPGCTDPTAINYDPAATVDDGSCIATILGCTDPAAVNYNPNANVDDGSCIIEVLGCTDPTAINYDPAATVDDGSCIAPIPGCTDPTAINYAPTANVDDGSCIATVLGCTDVTACNYNVAANTDDGSCTYANAGFDCAGNVLCPQDVNGNGVIEVGDLLLVLSEFGCSTGCQADVTGDGLVTVADVLALLSNFGMAC